MMKDLQRLLRLDWDEIGHTLLQSAAEQMAETAHLRANQTPEVIAIEAIAAGHIRLSVRSPDLMRREQERCRGRATPARARSCPIRS
jgi:hypothetical protein